ncbi:claudin-10-like isoform X6 [Electrophorus electricus]|uniref:Claudin n=1 Tax=Electrophorus electricus TaxID=8005 RepID=A0A4W4FG91_ELEEL|nr:claudin-10-like isoform X6 [Electrophorus electricus]
MSVRQIAALLAGLVGLGATFGATVSNEWKNTSRASSVITATWIFQGLWMNCAGNALGAVHCRQHHTIFKLEGYIQVCRGLMISAVCLGFFATGCALVGMKCTKIGGSDQVKARIACFAGFQFFVSGLCSLTACSLYAHRITSEFFDPMFMAQKYELGAALFIGWGGSALCILGGIVFFLSLSDGISKSSSQADKRRYLYSAASYVSSPGKMHNQSANGRRLPAEFSSTSQQFDKNAYV